MSTQNLSVYIRIVTTINKRITEFGLYVSRNTRVLYTYSRLRPCLYCTHNIQVSKYYNILK